MNIKRSAVAKKQVPTIGFNTIYILIKADSMSVFYSNLQEAKMNDMIGVLFRVTKFVKLY